MALAAISHVCRLADKSQEAARLFRTMSRAREKSGFCAEGSKAGVSGWQRWRFQRLTEPASRGGDAGPTKRRGGEAPGNLQVFVGFDAQMFFSWRLQVGGACAPER